MIRDLSIELGSVENSDEKNINNIEETEAENNSISDNKNTMIFEDTIDQGLTLEEKKNLNQKIALGFVGLFGFVITLVLEVFGASGAICIYLPFFYQTN